MKALARINHTKAAPGAVLPAIVRPGERELELKFLVSEIDFKAIQHSPLLNAVGGRSGTQRLHSIYFDTEVGDLRRHHIILRIRRLRGGQVLTLKWPNRPGGGNFERGEIEVPTHSAVPDPLLLGEDVLAEIARVTEGRPLKACFATDIKRTVRRVVAGGSEIEAAFDTGFVICGEQKSRVHEIELELKSGDPADLYQFGLSLARDYAVRLVTELVQHLHVNGEESARAGAIIAGWYSRGAAVNDVALRDAWKAFRKAEPFWRDALPERDGRAGRLIG